MKIKIVVIDLEIPARLKRWALRAGVPLAAIMVGGLAYAGLPHTFSSGEVLSAANLNADLQGLDSRLSALESTPATFMVICDTTTAAPKGTATLDAQVPAGWVASVTATGAETFAIKFASPFNAPPTCIGYFNSADGGDPYAPGATAMPATTTWLTWTDPSALDGVYTTLWVVCTGSR